MTWTLKHLEIISSILVDFTILFAAIVGIIKFRLYRLFQHRYMSEFRGTHHELEGGRIIFEGDYTVHNTGERPISISKVELKIFGTRSEKGLLVPNKENQIFERVMTNTPELKGLFDIQAGERSIFTIRCELPTLDDVVFVVCRLEWPHKRNPSPYFALYVKKKGQTSSLQS